MASKKDAFTLKIEINEDGVPIVKNRVALMNRIKKGIQFNVDLNTLEHEPLKEDK